MDKPLVSAIITTYKRPSFLIERALKSVLEQTYENMEIILVDDNDKDDAYMKANMEMAQGYPQIKYYRHKVNQGACAARNTGLKHASGEYVAFLDDDDEWLPEKTEKQISVFTSKEIGIVYCRGYVITESGTGTETSRYLSNIPFLISPTFHDLLLQDVIGSTSQPMIRKKCLDECGGFLVSLPARQDYELWLRISRNYKVVGINEPLFKYHVYEGEQITKSPLKAAVGNEIIYNQYKEDFKSYKEARYEILSRIAWYYKKCDRKNYLKYMILKAIHFFDKKRC